MKRSNTRKVRTLLPLVLFLSLGINVALISWVAGIQASDSRAVRSVLTDMMQRLPPEQQERATDIIQKHRDEIRQAMDAVREQRQEILTLVAQETPDQTRLVQAFGELRHRTARVQETGHAIVLEILPLLSPEQRRVFLDRPPVITP